MKKRIITIFTILLAASLAARGQSALGQLEHMTGATVSRSGASNSSQSAVGILSGILGSILQSTVEELLSPEAGQATNAAQSPSAVVANTAHSLPAVAPDNIIFCGPDKITSAKEGCSFYGRYPVPGESGWFLEFRKSNETPLDHDFTVAYWEKDGANGTPVLKYMRSGFPQNVIGNYLLGQTVDGSYRESEKRYKIESIVYND